MSSGDYIFVGLTGNRTTRAAGTRQQTGQRDVPSEDGVGDDPRRRYMRRQLFERLG